MEENTMEFKVGDVIENIWYDDKYKVVKIAKAGETVKGPWRLSKEEELQLYYDAYILEDKDGKWYIINTEDCSYTLIKVGEKEPEKTMDEDKVQKSSFQREIEECLHGLDPENPEEARRGRNLQDLYFNFYGRYFH